jgi:Kae1-associated kinase Bud32
MQKIIQQGAEAIITLKNKSLQKNTQKENFQVIQKHRIKKSYRIPVLDQKLRKRRTKAEAKIINKLQNIIQVPKIIETDNKENIIMEFINGQKLSENLENLDYKKICKQIAENISKLHDQNIIHGDLTTSNMILKTKKELNSDNKIYFIDFGLAFHSHKIEDKAVDLHLLKQALEAKHFKIAEKAIEIILKSYKANNHKLILERIKIIEKRGRYKH